LISPELVQFLYKAAASAAVGVVMAIILWPFRKARKEWVALKEEQASIHAELVTQRTNCLSTLQRQGDTQIELLTKVAGSLENIALSQAEMTGMCRTNTMVGVCKPRRRSKK